LEAASDPVRLLPLLIRILLKAPLELVLMAQGSAWSSGEACPRCGSIPGAMGRLSATP
jgi:hypothetical protein